MNRRSFLKLLGISPFAGFLFNKELKPSANDVAFARLGEIADYYDTSGPFIKFNGTWFFSDTNEIKWCPAEKLDSDSWYGIKLCNHDKFDFWQCEEGRLYWCGKRERWQIVVGEGYDIRLSFNRYYGIDEEVAL